LTEERGKKRLKEILVFLERKSGKDGFEIAVSLRHTIMEMSVEGTGGERYEGVENLG